MTMEIKQFALTEVKADDDARTIEGHGSVYGNVDNGGDIVLPGAFAKSINRMKSEGAKPRMLWQHKTDTPIGVWDVFSENPNALYVKGQIIDTGMGMDAYKLVKGGAINGLSIGYGVRDYSMDNKSGTRLLKELELYEVSLVTFPMNEKAVITAVKSKPENERELEEYLREAGYSHSEAKGIIAKGYKGIASQREVEGDDLERLHQLLTQFKF